MTDKLPPNLLALFAPRPALRYLPPSDHAPEDRKTNNIGGVAQFLTRVKEEGINEDVEYHPTESWLQRKDRLKMEKKERQQKLVTEGFAECMFFTVAVVVRVLGCVSLADIGVQIIRRMMRRFGEMRSRRFSSRG